MIEAIPVTEEQLRVAKDGALACPPIRTTRVFYIPISFGGTNREARFKKIIEQYRASIDCFNYENIFVAVDDGDIRIEVFPMPKASS